MNSARILGFGVWRSLVARLVRDEKVEGSNPFTPTIHSLNLPKLKR